MRRLTDTELNQAFENFEDAYFDHKPTAEEVFTLKLRAVASAQLALDEKALKEVVALLIEALKAGEGK